MNNWGFLCHLERWVCLPFGQPMRAPLLRSGPRTSFLPLPGQMLHKPDVSTKELVCLLSAHPGQVNESQKRERALHAANTRELSVRTYW